MHKNIETSCCSVYSKFVLIQMNCKNSNVFQENGIEDTAGYPKITANLGLTQEWTYTMRRSMQEIVRGLYLGPYSAATKSKLNFLIECNITHIVCVRQSIEAHFVKPNFPDKFK